MFSKSGLFDKEFLTKREVNPQVLESVVLLAIEIAREGREGRKIGTIFTVADSHEVLQRSRSLILDPLAGHPEALKNIEDPNLRETLKELAQLDGAFVISGSGTAISACRYLSATAEGVDLPLGLGSRHMAAASITRMTEAVAVVVSESSLVRVFDNGELVSEVIPELWMLRRFSTQVSGPAAQSTGLDDPVTVVNKLE